jgi:hypothetical protein
MSIESQIETHNEFKPIPVEFEMPQKQDLDEAEKTFATIESQFGIPSIVHAGIAFDTKGTFSDYLTRVSNRGNRKNKGLAITYDSFFQKQTDLHTKKEFEALSLLKSGYTLNSDFQVVPATRDDYLNYGYDVDTNGNIVQAGTSELVEKGLLLVNSKKYDPSGLIEKSPEKLCLIKLDFASKAELDQCGLKREKDADGGEKVRFKI